MRKLLLVLSCAFCAASAQADIHVGPRYSSPGRHRQNDGRHRQNDGRLLDRR